MEESVAVVGLDDHRVTFWSPSAERIFGWKAEEVLGKVLYEVAARDGWTREKLEALVARARAEGLFVVGGPRHRKDGAPLWIESTFGLTRDPAGAETGLLIVTRDITARKTAEDRLVASERALTEREAILTERMKELEDALAQVRTLRGLLPICMFCHKIRNGSEGWDALETYIASRTDAKFSHSICPSCETKHFPEDESKG